MPVFERNGKKYNVRDEHIDSFIKDFPDASTIMEREGKKYRVKSADYKTFMGETAEPLTGFGEGVKQGAESLYQGGRYAVAEFAGPKMQHYQDALDYISQEGFNAETFDKDKAYKEDRLQRFDRKVAEWRQEKDKRAKERENLGFFDSLIHKFNDPSMPRMNDYDDYNVDEEMKSQRRFNIVEATLKEAGGDLAKAKELLKKRASKETWSDRQQREASEALSQMKPVEGAAWWGQMVPQVGMQGLSLLSSASPYTRWLAKPLAVTSTMGLTLSSSGSAMDEARKAGATDSEVLTAGAWQGGIEYFSEKIPLDKLLGKFGGATFRKEVSERLLSEANKELGGKLAKEEAERLLTEANKKLGGKLISGQTVKEFVKNMTVEGLSEFIAEGAGTFVPLVYENSENYPTLSEALSNAWEGAKGGFAMGGFLGGGSMVLANRANNARRKKQGFVTLAETDDGVVEILGSDGANAQVLTSGGEVETVPVANLQKQYSYTYDEWKKGEVNSVLFNAQEAFGNAYKTTDAQGMASIKKTMKGARAAISFLSDEAVQRLDENPVPTLELMESEGATDEELQAVRDYVNASAAYKGMMQRMNEEADEQTRGEQERLTAISNEEGMVQPVVLDNDTRAYVQKGTLDDEHIVVVDDNGVQSMVAPSTLRGVENPYNAQESIQAMRDEYVNARLAELDNPVEPAQQTTQPVAAQYNYNDEVTILDDNNQPVRATIASNTDGDGRMQVETETPVNGKRVNYFTAEEIDGRLYEAPGELVTLNDGQNEFRAKVVNDLGNGTIEIQREGENKIDVVPASWQQAQQTEQSAPTKEAIPMEKVGKEERPAYHLVPFERTLEELHGDADLTQQDIDAFITANITELQGEMKKVAEKEPKMGANIAKFKQDKIQWAEKQKALQAKLDYYNELKKRNAELESSELQEAYNTPGSVEGVTTPDEVVAGLLGSIKITPESFKRETGLSTTEQKGLVGIIANEDKGGVSVERAAEIIAENYSDELAASGYTGDVQGIRNMLISVLSDGNPRTYAKRGAEQRANEEAENRRREIESWVAQFDMTVEEYFLYEQTMLPRVMRDYQGFDENEYYSILADEYNNSNYDTERESESVGRGREVLQGEQPVPARGAEPVGAGNEGGAVPIDVQGGTANGVAQEEVPVNEPVGNSEQLSSSEIPNKQSVAEGDAPGQSGGPKKIKGRRQVEKALEKMRKADAEGKTLEALNNAFTAEKNAKLGDEGAITSEEQAEIDAVKEKYAKQGYEIEDMTGKEYDEGVRLEAEFVIDESLPDGQQVIKSTTKPYILKDGVLVQEAKVVVALSPVKPIKSIGRGVFGEIYDDFKNGFKAAFDFLVGKKSGEAIGVFNRADVGEIDLVWGDEKGGLSHILEKYVGEGKSFENLDDAKNGIADIIENGEVVFQNGDKVVIKKGDKIVTLRKNIRDKGKKIADKNWILTAYDETKADGTSAISDTNKGQAAQPTVVSADESTTQSANKQENAQKSGENGTDSIIKGAKWEQTGEPEKMKWRTKKHNDSHDITWYLGGKRYGSTTAERDLLRVLADEYGNLNAVWNAYEQNQIILSSNEAAILKKLIETNTTRAELQQGDLSLERENPAFKEATERTVEQLKKVAPVEIATEEQARAMEGAEQQMIAEANERFNKELQQQIDGTLPKGHVYKLGMPSAKLLAAKIEDLPIELPSWNLLIKSKKDYKSNHPYKLSYVKDLVYSMQNPIAVFDSEEQNGKKVILTELKNEKGDNFIVVIDVRKIGGRNFVEVNSVISLYPKDSAVRIAKWFDSEMAGLTDKGKEPLLKWADKNKTLIWLANHSSDVNAVGLSHKRIANIVNKFNNNPFKPDFSRAAAPFYSNAKKAVLDIKQEKATPQQWIAMLKKNGGLKAGEDAWVGLEKWLGEQESSVTKQQIIDYINENSIQIEEVRYSQFGYGLMDEAARNLETEVRAIGWNAVQEKFPGIEDFFEFREGKILWNEESASIGEYEDFIIDNKLVDVNAQDNAINETRERYTTEGLGRKREIALVVPTIESWNASDDVHFGDAGNGRAVAWVRFGETTDSEGNRVLVIDEIQSKRHQAGRDEGYKDTRAYEREKRNLDEKAQELFQRRKELIRQLESKYGAYTTYLKKVENNRVTSLVPNEDVMTPEEIKEYNETSQEGIVKEEAALRKKYFDGVPSAPFEKNWHELAMKRMLRLAAEEGFDKVAWTTGEQQAERYNLGAVLKGLKAYKTSANEYYVIPYNNGVIGEFVKEYTEQELVDTFGKELAQKIVANAESATEENPYEIEGEEIRVGGEGMKGFYDRMLPSFVQKYTKKWGAQVGEVDMPSLKENSTMWSVDVTPAMRESVMQGQPMFFRTANGTVYGWAVNGKVYLTPEGINPNTPVHEYTHLWASAVEKSNPKEWAKIVEGLKASPAWNEVLADEGYRDIWNNDNRVASEVLSRLAGRENYRREMERAQREIDNATNPIEAAERITFRESVKQAVQRFWDNVKRLFQKITGKAGEGSWEDFVEMPLRDFWAGVKPEATGSPLDRMFIGEQGAANDLATAEEGDVLNREGTPATEEFINATVVASNWGNTHKGAAPCIVIQSAETLRAQLEQAGFSAEDIADAEKDSNSCSAEYFPTADKVVIYNINAVQDEIIGYLWHENAHKAIGEIYTEEEVERAFKAVVGEFEQEVREQLTEMGYTEKQQAEEYFVQEFERMWLDENTRAMLERGRFSAKESAPKEYKIFADFIKPIIKYINNGGERGYNPDGGIRESVGENQGGYVGQHQESLEVRNSTTKRGTPKAKRGTDKTGATLTIEDGQKGETDRSGTPGGGILGRNGQKDTGVHLRNAGNESGDTRTGIKARRGTGVALTFDEAVAKGLMELAAKNSEDYQLRVDALKSFTKLIKEAADDLVAARVIRGVAARQKDYDKATVQKVMSLASLIMNNSLIDNFTRGEVKRLIGAIHRAVGKKELMSQGTEIVSLITDRQIKACDELLTKQLKTKASKINASGVEVQSGLDIKGQRIMGAFKDGKKLDIAKLNQLIAAAREKMGSADNFEAENAALDLQGYMLAQQYLLNIKASEDELASLKMELKSYKEQYDAGKISHEDYKASVALTEEAMLANKLERVGAYLDIMQNFGIKLRASVQAAAEFREREVERARAIQHNANSDMQGISADSVKPDRKRWEKVADFLRYNNPITRGLMLPMATFENLLKKIGEHSVAGRGYLYDRFVPQFERANDTEYRKVRQAMKELDSKLSEIFGKEMKWNDLAALEKSMPGMSVKFWSNGQMIERQLSQGHMLYIYMVNKMVDGRMKLNAMGITEDKVREIISKTNHKFIELADWIQDTFLQNKRREYNAVYERMFGAPMANIEDYFPLVINQRDLPKEIDVAAYNNADTLPSTITGSVIKRVRNNKPLDITNANAFAVVVDHINKMEHWAAFAEFNRDLNVLLSYNRFKNQVLNMKTVRFGSGEELWNTFRDVCAMAAGSYVPEKGMADEILTNLSKGVAYSKVSFGINTAIKQLLSTPAFATNVGLTEVASNIFQAKAAWDWANSTLPGFKERIEQGSAGDNRLNETDADWDWTKMEWVQKVKKAGMLPNIAVDAVVVAIGAKSVYDTKVKGYKADGYSDAIAHEKALADAAIVYNTTQQSGERAYLSKLQQDRTFLATLLSTFRNNSFAYGRIMFNAVSNLKNMIFKSGYREESIGFMTKKMVREGLSEENARKAAERIYNRAYWKNIAELALFSYGLQLLWNLGANMWYLLLGDDDEEKKEIIKDAVTKSAFMVDGVAAGDMILDVVEMAKRGRFDSNVFASPFVADLSKIGSDLVGNNKARGVMNLANCVAASMVGVSPQRITDVVVAIIDVCDGDLDTANEVGYLLMRVAQVPESQQDKFYLDEVEMNAAEAKQADIEMLAKRYARYKRMKEIGVVNFALDDFAKSQAEEKYFKRFEKMFRERLHKDVAPEEYSIIKEYEESGEYKEIEAQLKHIKENESLSPIEYATRMDNILSSPEGKRFLAAKGYKKNANWAYKQRRFEYLGEDMKEFAKILRDTQYE